MYGGVDVRQYQGSALAALSGTLEPPHPSAPPQHPLCTPLHPLYTPLHPSCTPSTPRTPRQVSGTLQAGTLRPGQKLLLLPGAEVVHAKAVHSRGVAVTLATAGDHVEVTPTYPPAHPPTRLPRTPISGPLYQPPTHRSVWSAARPTPPLRRAACCATRSAP